VSGCGTSNTGVDGDTAGVGGLTDNTPNRLGNQYDGETANTSENSDHTPNTLENPDNSSVE